MRSLRYNAGFLGVLFGDENLTKWLKYYVLLFGKNHQKFRKSDTYERLSLKLSLSIFFVLEINSIQNN